MSKLYEYKMEFDSPLKQDWIYFISYHREEILKTKDINTVSIYLNERVLLNNFESKYIVLFSCFIYSILSKEIDVKFVIENKDLEDFLYNYVKFQNDYQFEKGFKTSNFDLTNTNLWKIEEASKEIYSTKIHDYFKRKQLNSFDLSSLKNSINELFFNIFDHSNAEGVTFSYIELDDHNMTIKVAICDFGIGIINSLRSKYKFRNDEEYLINSIEIGVSAKSKKYNKGFGLNNVISLIAENDFITILSNKAQLCYKILNQKQIITTNALNFDFCGTLINFEVSIKNFSAEEIIEDTFFYN